jgi:hypothetical protein
VLVASALMGVGIVTGLTALSAAERVGTAATRQAWATCAVRAEAQALEAAPWSSGYPQPRDGVRVSIGSSPQSGLQVITVSAGDARAVVYKAQALSPSSSSAPTPQADAGAAPYAAWCDQVPRSGP